MKKFFKITSEGKIEGEVWVEKTKKEKNFREFQYLGIGFYLIAPIFLGLILGLLLRQVVFFLFLGTIFSFFNLFKITKE